MGCAVVLSLTLWILPTVLYALYQFDFLFLSASMFAMNIFLVGLEIRDLMVSNKGLALNTFIRR